ncbi:MAG: FCD domain-containing protein [Chloroflexota bacterium]
MSSDFLHYLAAQPAGPNGDVRLPSLHELSQQLGLSVAALREQLEVARALGLVEVRPRTGIRRLEYSFLPAVRQSLDYALALEGERFLEFADLRDHLEAAYWDEAVRRLLPEDHQRLQDLLGRAWEKLLGQPVHIPHEEHRQLHLLIFSRLDNPFLLGLLEAYWEAYEAVNLNLFADYAYLQQVWGYHQRMVEAICQGDYAAGYRALTEHKDLLYHRPSTP